MISIVIPLYNKEKQIENTLRSVLGQTFPYFELLIVNDGSTDKGMEIVRQFTDKRIRIVEQTNQGVSAARNCGIEKARFNYIALLDADDEWEPHYLETQAGLIRSFPHCGVFACAYAFRYEDKVKPIILNKIPFGGESGVLANYFQVACASHPPLWTSAVVVKKEAFSTIGGFPVGIVSGEDLLTWARLAVKYPIAYTIIPGAFFIIPSDITHRDNRLDLNEKEKVQNELLKLVNEASSPVQQKYLRRYIGRWNEMVASALLRKGRGKESAKYILRVLKCKGPVWKMLFFAFLSFMPGSFQKKIMNR